MPSTHLPQRLLHTIQELGRLGQHLLAPAEDHPQVGGGDAPIRDLDGGLDHREGEGLDPIAVNAEVAHLDLGQVGVDVRLRNVATQKLAKGGLGELEACFVVPQRVVAVERHVPY